VPAEVELRMLNPGQTLTREALRLRRRCVMEYLRVRPPAAVGPIIPCPVSSTGPASKLSYTTLSLTSK